MSRKKAAKSDAKTRIVAKKAKKAAARRSTVSRAKAKPRVKAVKAAKTRRPKAEPIPFVMKDNYIQVTVEGKPFSLDNTHPTFTRMKKALKDKNWKAVPRLVTLAQSLVSASLGNVEVKNGKVFYKGSQVDDALTERIVGLVKANERGVQHLMNFMNNLYKNPSPEARREFYPWLKNSNLPLSDDGCFFAYKAVNSSLRDTHTGTVDNSPGQVIMMPRNNADPHWRTACSSGFHICSKSYGIYGSRVMLVKVNPRDVVAAPANEGKIRVVRYEVIKELSRREMDRYGDDNDIFKEKGFGEVEGRAIVAINAEKKELVKMLLAAPEIKRQIKNGKVKEATIRKYPVARLTMMAQKYEVIPEAQMEARDDVTPMRGAREAAGLTIGQIVKESGLDYKTIAKLEKDPDPNRQESDKILAAIARLKNINVGRSAISFPKAVK